TDFSALRTNRAALWTTMLGAILNLSLLTRNRYSMISSNQTGAGAHDETLAAATKVSAPFAWLPARGTNSQHGREEPESLNDAEHKAFSGTLPPSRRGTRAYQIA